MALIGDQPLHQTDYPSKRFKPNDSDGDSDEQLASLASSKQTPTRLSSPPIPIYGGPGEGYGSTYFCMFGAGDTYDHSIYFKGDKFTVREDRQLWIEEEDKHKRPVDDTTIRSVWDPKNKEFLESLVKEECPAEFSKGRQGNHYIHIYGLHDDQ
ncbi:hypothetical protein FRX31_013360, partial [Thalictrum thalictroides]